MNHLLSLSEQQEFISKLKEIKRTKFFLPNAEEPMDSVLLQLNLHFDRTDCDYLIGLARCQRLIVSSIKNRDYLEAQEIIDLAERVLESMGEAEAKILGSTFVFPSFAYFETKKKNFQLAKNYIDLVIKYDDRLSYKFPVLHLHKIHHILNLNQVFLATNNHKECVNIFLEFFTYFSTYKLDPKYGMGGKSYFDNMNPDNNLSSATNRFINEYFLCVWENPEVEVKILKHMRKKRILDNVDIKDQNLNAWKDLCTIQLSLLSQKPHLQLILDFFFKYDHYYFDPLRLLILKSLYPLISRPENKAEILKIIDEKLNFKQTDLISKRVSESKSLLNE